MRRTLLLFGVFVLGLVLLAGCFRVKEPSSTDQNESALFTNNELDQAKATTILSELELQGNDLDNIEENIEGAEAPEEMGGDLEAQATLPSVDGYLAYYRENGSSYQVWVANQKDDSKTNIYSSSYPIQSVAVNGDGKWVAASIQNASGYFDVYLFDLNSKTVINLTKTNNKSELDVSITVDASKIVFSRPSSSGLNRINICDYDIFRDTCVLSVLNVTNEQTQASVSGNGRYISLIRKLPTTQNRVLLYDVSSKTYTTVITLSKPVSHPSPSNDGNSVMFLRDDTATTGKYVAVVKDLSTNQLANELSSATLGHPHLTADASYFAYDAQVSGRQRVFTRNISTDAKASAAGGTWNYRGGYWQKNVGFDCSSLSLSVTTGKPGDTVLLSRTGGDFGNIASVSGAFRLPSSTEESVVFIEKVDKDLQFIVPVHPQNQITGGSVRIFVTLNGQRCPAFSFQIASLPDPNAQGVKNSYISVANRLQTFINNQATQIGIDPAILKGDLTNLPSNAFGLGMSQYFVDHPDNPNSMKALARRGTYINESTGEATPINVGLMDSLFADKNVPTLIKTIINELEVLASSQSVTRSSVPAGSTVPIGSLQAQACPSNEFRITTPADLDYYMKEQAKYQEQVEKLEPIVSSASKTILLLTLAAPLTGGITAIAGTGMNIGFLLPMLAMKINAEYHAALLPSQLQWLTVEVTVDSFEAKGPVPEFGEISKIELAIAPSKTFDASEAIKDVVFALPTGFLPGPTKELWEDAIFEYVKAVIDYFVDDIGLAVQGPYCWDPIDVTNEPDYIDVSVEGVSIELIDTLKYAPVPMRSGFSTILAKTLPSKFAGKSAEGKAFINVIGYLEITNTLANVSLNYNTSTTIDINWEGTAKFPVIQSLLVSSCDSNFSCYPGNQTVNNEANPLKQGLGCFCRSGSCNSGGGSFYIHLEDSQGLVATSNVFRLSCIGSSGSIISDGNSQEGFIGSGGVLGAE
jgi:hypothetical protein